MTDERMFVPESLFEKISTGISKDQLRPEDLCDLLVVVIGYHDIAVKTSTVPNNR